MANLKRNMIELVKNPEEVNKGGEVAIERFWTPVHIPLKDMYEALDLSVEMAKIESGKSKKRFRDAMDLMMDFIANKEYNGQFTKDDLVVRLHAPDAIYILQEQIGFMASGEQSGGTRYFLEKKNELQKILHLKSKKNTWTI